MAVTTLGDRLNSETTSSRVRLAHLTTNSKLTTIAVLNKMRYTPLATDALCPMPYALCPMPARAPHVTEKGYTSCD